MEPYKNSFYEERDKNTKNAANTILELIWQTKQPEHVLDIGCGVGTWLKIAEEKGASFLSGIEGPWVKGQTLSIPEESITIADLESSFPDLKDKKYDLAICLEVAEHLSDKTGKTLVDSLCKNTDLILFSAAIPGQGGKRHINEQWQSYWAKLFFDNGFYVYDCVRPKIWGNSDIPFWYRQNTILFSREVIHSLEGFNSNFKLDALDVVHPDLFNLQRERLEITMIQQRIKRGLKRRIKELI